MMISYMQRHRLGWGDRLPVDTQITRLIYVCLLSLTCSWIQADSPIVGLARDSQKRVVKIYGAGGIAGLEAYQSGFIVSPEGHIATAWSYVLDVEPIVLLDDGRRYEAEIVGFEPALELAVLKIEASDLPFFAIDEQLEVQWETP